MTQAGNDAREAALSQTCTSLVVKLAMRCNIACRYCYWFRDAEVYERPSLMSEEIAAALVHRVERHLMRADVQHLTLLFHGGEPLLYGAPAFKELCIALRAAEQRAGKPLELRIMSNGMLLNEEWFEALHAYRVALGISLDGPQAVHDARRVDHAGKGTHQRVVSAIAAAREWGINVGVLAVCDPAVDPCEVADAIIALGIDAFDILVPDATHLDTPASIAPYYTRLFDRWYDTYGPRGVEIRLLTDIVRGLLGTGSRSQSIGGGAITTATICTDGAIEALDTLRAAGRLSSLVEAGATPVSLNILNDDIASIARDPLWQEIVASTSALPTPCRGCPVSNACGGGHVAHRWSPSTRYDNRSVYCDDLKQIIAHAWSVVSKDLYVECADGRREELAV